MYVNWLIRRGVSAWAAEDARNRLVIWPPVVATMVGVILSLLAWVLTQVGGEGLITPARGAVLTGLVGIAVFVLLLLYGWWLTTLEGLAHAERREELLQRATTSRRRMAERDRLVGPEVDAEEAGFVAERAEGVHAARLAVERGARAPRTAEAEVSDLEVRVEVAEAERDAAKAETRRVVAQAQLDEALAAKGNRLAQLAVEEKEALNKQIRTAYRAVWQEVQLKIQTWALEAKRLRAELDALPKRRRAETRKINSEIDRLDRTAAKEIEALGAEIERLDKQAGEAVASSRSETGRKNRESAATVAKDNALTGEIHADHKANRKKVRAERKKARAEAKQIGPKAEAAIEELNARRDLHDARRLQIQLGP